MFVCFVCMFEVYVFACFVCVFEVYMLVCSVCMCVCTWRMSPMPILGIEAVRFLHASLNTSMPALYIHMTSCMCVSSTISDRAHRVAQVLNACLTHTHGLVHAYFVYHI